MDVADTSQKGTSIFSAITSSKVGKGLGQETGKATVGALANTPEAQRLVNMIVPLLGNLTGKEREFIADMRDKFTIAGQALVVTGRQLGWLRDIKDQLVERGLL